jgi:hypothetical protein
MWFAKLFGGRRKADEALQDEPARFAAPQHSNAPLRDKSPASDRARPVESSPAGSTKAPQAARPQGGANSKGFDPYNSGAFERRNAWERISRR